MQAKSVFAAIILAGVLAVPALADDFKLTSTSIHEGQPMSLDTVYTGCGGKNLSPELAWSGAPAGTKSFAITAYDPDAPTGSGWWHWMVVNVPANVDQIPQGASGTDHMPEGAVQVHNDFGGTNFGGACPPAGHMHRYEFTIHALDVAQLPVRDGASTASIGFAIHAHTLASARITAVYTR